MLQDSRRLVENQTSQPHPPQAGLARVNLAKRRIYLRFVGPMTLQQVVAMREEYRAAINQVGSGYTVLTYFADFSASPEVQEEMSSMVVLANQGGCRRAARVVGDSRSASYQVRRLAQKDAAYPHRSFSTLAEAEAYLDSF